MDISYYKKMEPFWGVWRIKRLIGEGSFGKVFEIEREDFGRVYKAALKAITIPQSESELRSVLADGMDRQSAGAYYRGFVEEVVDEFALMAELKGNSNIVSYEDHTVVEHKDGIGWDILIRMELLTPLLEYTSVEHPLERDEVVKLGIDLCRALEYCQRQNIIHRDIKPENIFVSGNGDFKLGDFGIARTVEKTMSGLSRKGTYTYMAPEVYKGEKYGPAVDIYSLGIVLYRLLNHNRTPFLPEYPAPITHSDRERAVVKRISGEKIPLPVDAQDKLGEIVLKACAHDPRDRYAAPDQMRMELEGLFYADTGIPSYGNNESTRGMGNSHDAENAEGRVRENTVEDGTEIVMDIVEECKAGEDMGPVFGNPGAVDPDATLFLFDDSSAKQVQSNPAENSENPAENMTDSVVKKSVESEKRKKKTGLMIGFCVVALAAVFLIIFAVNSGGRGDVMVGSGTVSSGNDIAEQKGEIAEPLKESNLADIGEDIEEKTVTEGDNADSAEQSESEVVFDSEPEFLTFVEEDKEYTVEINPNVDRHDYNIDAFERQGYKMSYTDFTKYDYMLGVDVSYHQGTVDWEKVRADGYEFAFIRLGYRGYGQEGKLNLDSEFYNNLTNADSAGMYVGVYFYSQAINETEAVEEAEFVIDTLDQAGYYEKLPVIYVAEKNTDIDARNNILEKEQFTRNAKAFCQRVEEEGYQPMIYARLLGEAYLFDLEELDAYSIWYADYSGSPRTPYNFMAWQYFNQAEVDGIPKPVDLNIQLIQKQENTN